MGVLVFGINYFTYNDTSSEFDMALFVYATNSSSGSLESQVDGTHANNNSELASNTSSSSKTNNTQTMTAEEAPFFCGNKTQGSSYYVNE
ncbi:MAG TPA: hypothetical protein VER14_00415, partial [Phototrophicaceae bacterium]|nr:hypothetical protein [Phototrophicaceae bacterium]